MKHSLRALADMHYSKMQDYKSLKHRMEIKIFHKRMKDVDYKVPQNALDLLEEIKEYIKLHKRMYLDFKAQAENLFEPKTESRLGSDSYFKTRAKDIQARIDQKKLSEKMNAKGIRNSQSDNSDKIGA
jgi:hypothetical protein